MQTSKFVIIREDLNVDPTTLVADGLKIGRSPDCELVLNHPTVSRLHAGVNETGGRFYIFNFSHSSGTAINGRVVAVESAEVLADGDLVQIGPFFLQLERESDALVVRVTLEVAVRVGEAEGRVEIPNAEPQPSAAAAGQDDPELSDALNVFWEKRKREEGKMQRISPLRPRAPSRVLGKARFNWTPTRDLVRPWPFSVFIWAAVIVAALAGLAAVAYSSAYTPAPISSPHARTALLAQPAIARRPNGSSCTTCHTLTGSMEAKCADCHQAEGFAATVTDAHREAGVGCTSCHVEHQGTEFRPSVASLQTCTNCHNDANPKTFNGRRVGTPHGGTFGYPVAGGRWTWKGLEKDEWERKPAELREALSRMEEAARRWPTSGDPVAARRTAEFHALHLHRVKAVGGLRGDKDGQLSCGTCHQSFAPIDRATPRTTCGTCHNGDPGGKFERVLAADQPNCNSCHVQHVKGRREWGASLLARSSEETRKTVEEAPRFVSSVRN